MSRACVIDGCDRDLDLSPGGGRGMCNAHYRRWQRGSDLTAPIKAVPPDSPVCQCPVPVPTAVGACALCGRLVVTFAHSHQDRFRAQWPEEWARAVYQGAVPR